MKNKGFTLVELLAVLSVLAVVVILITPTMLSALKNGKNLMKKYDNEGVEDAGIMYITDLDTGVKDYVLVDDETIEINEHTYKKGDILSSYDFKVYVINKGGIDVNMRQLVNEGYYDKNCRYAGEEFNGEVLTEDKNCHMPSLCTLHVSIDYTLSPDGRYYVTNGYTAKMKSGCEK